MTYFRTICLKWSVLWISGGLVKNLFWKISYEFCRSQLVDTLRALSISVEERDIIELEKRYWVLKGESRTGKLDLETLRPLISPPVPLSVCAGVFAAFDENRDNHIDFKEMACGISAATRGPMVERQKCKFLLLIVCVFSPWNISAKCTWH